MSSEMLHGVLNMPPDCWSNDCVDEVQRHTRYVEASERIKELEDKLQFLIDNDSINDSSIDKEVEQLLLK